MLLELILLLPLCCLKGQNHQSEVFLFLLSPRHCLNLLGKKCRQCLLNPQQCEPSIIPVGCIPPTSVAFSWEGWGAAQGGCLLRGGVCPRGVFAHEGVYPMGGGLPREGVYLEGGVCLVGVFAYEGVCPMGGCLPRGVHPHPLHVGILTLCPLRVGIHTPL